MADDPRLALLRGAERPLQSRSGFTPIPPTRFIPIDALRQNIQFYQNQLQQLRAQERIYDLGGLGTAMRGFRQSTLDNPIIRRTERMNGVNYSMVSYYYLLPRDGNWIPYTRNALRQSDFIGDREGVQTQLILSQFQVGDGLDFHLGGETLKTTFRNTSTGALQNLIAKKTQKEDEYDEELVLRTLIVRRFIPNTDIVVGQGTGRSEKHATQSWLILDKKARTNCFYNFSTLTIKNR